MSMRTQVSAAGAGALGGAGWESPATAMEYRAAASAPVAREFIGSSSHHGRLDRVRASGDSHRYSGGDHDPVPGLDVPARNGDAGHAVHELVGGSRCLDPDRRNAPD